jgi:glycosyltransferase involved in cell wall biosynthesis
MASTEYAAQTCKVAFQVVPAFLAGGAERLVVHLAQALDRDRYQPICIAYDPPTGSHYEAMLQDAGIPLIFLYKRRPLDIRVLMRLHRLFRQYRPRIVHMHISGINYTYPLLLIHRPPVQIYTIHSVAEKDLHFRREGRLIQRLAFRYRWGRVVPVAISEVVRESFKKYYGYPDLPVIPNGIPVESYAPDATRRARWRQREGFPMEAILIAAVAGLRPEKNLALLIHAFAQLEYFRPLHLLLVGSGEQEAMLRRLAAQLGLSERVHFLGVRADIPDVLNACDLFALSSRWEGTPMAIMEAMASGLPVVSTAVGGVPELVQHGYTGFLVPPDEESALRNALQQLVDDAALRHQMGLQALEYARAHFDIRQTARQYEALYAALESQQEVMRGKKGVSSMRNGSDPPAV